MRTLQFKKVTQDVEDHHFDCGVQSINEYVKFSYWPFIIQHAYAYSITYGDKVLGYYQLLFRDIELEKLPPDIADYDFDEHYRKVTAVHIRYIAIDKAYQGHKIGTNVMKAIINDCRELAKDWPIRVITLDANVDLVDWYSGFDFQVMPYNTPGQDGITTAMCLDCMMHSEELAQY